VASAERTVRTLIASGWVGAVPLDPETPRGRLAEFVDAARTAGRTVTVKGPLRVGDLPAPGPGERWAAEQGGGEDGWRLVFEGRSRWQRAAKRVLDVVVASALIVLLSPLLLAIAVAVRLTSAGPVFYGWRVLGRDGQPFVGYKFRTMVRDADELKATLLAHNRMVGPVFKMTKDPRITPLGRWLRRYSLDELPQLWSVVRGHMSLVGPRPVFPTEYQQFELWQMRKLSVVPGITCLWQVNGRNAIADLDEWVRLDLDYVDRWSLGLDLRILLRTLLAVVRGTGQ
jgi:lipopolysaccharide/colanic/teichoic acid biosynthesis glycosyltransferase